MAEASAVKVALAAETPQTLFTKLRPGPGAPASEVASNQRARIDRAMVEATAEGGYDAVTIRRLAELAGVSTRTLYTHRSGKEDCLLSSLTRIVHDLVTRLAEARTSSTHPDSRTTRMLGALTSALADDAPATRLLLVETYGAGPLAAEQAQRASRLIGMQLAQGHGDLRDGGVPRLGNASIGAGVLGVARSYLLSGRLDRLRSPEVVESLSEWVSSCEEASSLGLAPPLPSSATRLVEEGVDVSCGDRALLLTAVVKLATAKDGVSLTPRQIYASAGVSREAFYRNFGDARECLAAALDLRVRAQIARAGKIATTGATPIEGLYRALVFLCSKFGAEEPLARIGLDKIAVAGEWGLHRRQDLIAEVCRLIEGQLPPMDLAEQLSVEASIHALWAALEASGGAAWTKNRGSTGNETLTYLALAPILGRRLEGSVGGTTQIPINNPGRSIANDE